MTADVAVDRVAFIGGEMYGWTDEVPGRSAGGTALYLPTEHLVGPGTRVLVAGPHEPGVLRRLLDLQADVVWLTRSHIDAVRAAEMFADSPRLRILGGCLSRMPTTETYDVVVALDGMGRLSSAEEETLSWTEALEILTKVLDPAGQLLLSVDNPIGIHRLVQPDAWYADRSDSAFLLADEVDPTKPQNLLDFRARLTGVGLYPADVFAAFPDPARPLALINTALLDTGTSEAQRAALADVVSDVSRQGWRAQPLLTEPQWLTSNAIRNGIGVGIAASWVIAARRTPASEQVEPRVIITDQPGVEDWGVTYMLTPTRDGWNRRALHPATPQVDDTLCRDPDRLNGAVTIGQAFQQSLIATCLRHDHVGLRHALKAYAKWLRQLVAAGDPSAPFATPANVSYDGTAFAIRDGSWQDLSQWPFDLVVTKALREFAVELLTGGYNHPWPSTMDANRLTIVLGAIAGLEIDIPIIDRAVRQEVVLRGVIAQLDEDGLREYAHRLAGAGSTTGDLSVFSFQRLRQAHARQAEQIVSLEDKVKWLDHLLASRELALTRARKEAQSLASSISFRVGRAIITPALATRKVSRRAMKRLRTPVELPAASDSDTK